MTHTKDKTYREDWLDKIFEPIQEEYDGGEPMLPGTINEVKQAIQEHIEGKVLEGRLSERAWAYKNMRDHNTDPKWVEVAKSRYDKIDKQLKDKGGSA